MIRRLATKAELCYQLAIPCRVLGFQIVEQLAPLVDHFQQALTAVVIFFVLAEVLGKIGNTRRQQGYLHFGRSRVRVAAGIIFNNAAFLLTGQLHFSNTSIFL